MKMKFLSGIFVLIVSLLFAGVLRAQPAADEAKIDPDRPDFTTGTSIVPQGHVQIESGATATRRGDEREYSLGEVQLRLPISKRAEVRFDVPAYLDEFQETRETGLDDSMIGLRLLLSKKKKSQFALQISSMLPTGSQRVAEKRYQPEAIAAASFELSSRTQLIVNGGIRRASKNQQRFTRVHASSLLQYEISPRLNVFAEAYIFNKLEADGSSQKFAATGALFYLNPHTTLDALVGTGLNNKIGGPDFFYRAGLSHLF